MNLCCHENLKYPQSICFYFKLWNSFYD
jgi:hypothetical protein